MVTPEKRRGRPKIDVDNARVLFTVRVAPKTSDALIAEADRRGVSRGIVLDDLVAKHLLRKRKT